MLDDAVSKWFSNFEHPLKEEMLTLRETILKSDPRMGECIKWKAPTFIYQGNLATINPRARKHITLMFHTGAKIPGEFSDLEGDGKTARHMTFKDQAELESKSPELCRIVKAWCDLKDQA